MRPRRRTSQDLLQSISDVLSVPGRKWWRFDRYEISNGFIRPAAGARLESYEPWEQYRQSKQTTHEHGKRKAAAPYRSLIDICNNIKVVPRAHGHSAPSQSLPVSTPRGLEGSLYGLAAESESIITTWCAENGLLGILTHHACMVALATRWRPLSSEKAEQINRLARDQSRLEAALGRSPTLSPPLRAGQLVPTRSVYVRTASGWVAAPHVGTGHTAETDRIQEGEVVDQSIAGRYWDAPHALIRDYVTREYRLEALTESWSHFFPDVPEAERATRAYPLPLSAEFWHQYAEPVFPFVFYGRRLGELLRDIAGARPLNKNPLAEQWSTPLAAKAILNELAEPVSLALGFRLDGTCEQGWSSPSLLGFLTMMALLDLTEGWRARECAACSRQFLVGPSSRERYCSKTCRWNAQKRRYRQRLQKRPAGRIRKRKGE